MKIILRKIILLIFLVLALSISIYASDEGRLPIIYITTDSGKPIDSKIEYVSGKMKLVSDSSDKVKEYKIEIKGRGNSTWSQDKKPYKIKLKNKVDLFGMGENKHWVLLANALDGSHLRNTLAYNFSGEIGLYNIKNIHVELYFNGEYVGLYQFTEDIRVGKNRIDIFDWSNVTDDISTVKSNKYDITGGYILELDEYYDKYSKFITEHDVPIMVSTPEYTADNKEMFDYIKNYVQDMENAFYSYDGYNKKDMHYSQYVDLDSFIDYWIVNQAFKSVELLFKSCFMYKDTGGLLVFGPVWDMDWSSGNHVNLVDSSASYNEWNHSESQDREYWYRAIYHDPFFTVRLQDRWKEVRPILEKYINSIDDWKLKLDHAVKLNQDVWGANDGWSYERECAELKTWMLNRAEWMDSQLNKRDPNIMGLGIGNDKSTTIEAISTKDGAYDVNIQANIKQAKIADVYVNGLKYQSLPIIGGAVSLIVTPDNLFDSDTKRNVIRVIIRAENGVTVYGDSYIALSNEYQPKKSDVANDDIFIVIVALVIIWHCSYKKIHKNKCETF